jgi:solute carrier family 35, member F5
MRPFSHLFLGQIAKVGFIFFIFYFASNYATTMSFGTTSAGSASILASTCGFFTLIFGRLIGVEELSPARLVAVAISVGGVLILGKSEFEDRGTKTLGNILSLVGAALYGVYSVFLKKVTKDESRISMPILFAFVGLYTMLLTWPIFWGFHQVKWETFEVPPNWKTVGYILINMFLGAFIPNYLWNVAFVLTSPLVVAIGISFNIPLTLIGEYLIDGQMPAWYKWVSAVCVVIGFVIVNLVTIYPKLDLGWKQLVRCNRDRNKLDEN